MDYQPISNSPDDSRSAHVSRRGLIVLGLGALASVVFFFALRPQPLATAKSSAVISDGPSAVRFPVQVHVVPIVARTRMVSIRNDFASMFDAVCTSSTTPCVGEIPENTRLFFVRRECKPGLVADRCLCLGVNNSALVLVNRQDHNACSCLFQATRASSRWTMHPNCHWILRRRFILLALL